jgi:DNA-binding response OmpR family regulator
MRRRVLIVDDEPDILEVARMSLETVAGWHVLVATDGRAATELARTERPDAVVLDVMMPDLDGPATLALIREHAAPEDLPALFLTAKAQAFDAERLERLAAQGTIAKPFDPMTLGTQISSALGWPLS